MQEDQLEILTKMMNLRTELDKFLDSGECPTFRGDESVRVDDEIDALIETLKATESVSCSVFEDDTST